MTLQRILATAIFVCMLAMAGIAQSASDRGKPADEPWTRIESVTQDFSFELPRGFLVYKEFQRDKVWYSKDGVTIYVDLQKGGDGKYNIRHFSSDEDKKNYKFYDKGDFIIRQYTAPDENDFRSFSL